LEQRSRTDAGELQQLRRVEAPARQDHLACRAHLVAGPARLVGHAGGALAFEQDTSGERLDLDLQVRTLLRRAQVADRGAATPAVARRGLVVAGTLLARAVEVVIARDAERHRRS